MAKGRWYKLAVVAVSLAIEAVLIHTGQACEATVLMSLATMAGVAWLVLR